MAAHALQDAAAPGLPETAERAALDAALTGLDRAGQAGTPAALCNALAEVGRALRAAGALAEAEQHLQQALRWSRVLGAVDPVIDLSCELAEVAAARAERERGDAPLAQVARDRARNRGLEAVQLAQRCADPGWEATVLLRVSEVLDRCGDHEDAIRMQCRALELIAREAVRA